MAPVDVLAIAPRWRRALAGLVDTAGSAAIALGLIAAGLVPGAFFFEPIEGLLLPEAVGLRLVQRPWLLAEAIAVLTMPLVFWHLFWGLVSRTPGERIGGLVAVDSDGLVAGRLRRSVRAIGYSSWGATLGLAAFFPWISRTQRGFPDLIARTWVVDALCPAGRNLLAGRGPRLVTSDRPSASPSVSRNAGNEEDRSDNSHVRTRRSS